MTLDKTLILAGPRPRRVRLRVVKSSLEQTTYSAKGVAKVAKKKLKDELTATREFEKAVRKKLREDYAVVNQAGEPGSIILEAFAPGGGGGAVLDMSLDGALLVTASITTEQEFGAKLELVEVATGARRVVMEEPGGVRQSFLHAALFDHDARSIYFTLRDDTYRLDLATGARTQIAQGDHDALNPFVVQPCFDAERERLVVFARGPCVRVLDRKGKKLLDVSTKSKTAECRAAAISPSGRLLAVYMASRYLIYNHDDAKRDKTNEVQLWDIEAGERWETVTVDEKLRRVGFAPEDDTLLVTYDYAEGPVALEIPTGRELWKLTDPDGDDGELAHTQAWAYSRDGKRLAVAGRGLHLLDAKRRTPILALSEHGARVDRVVFSRDGTRLAAAMGGRAVVFAI